MEDRKEISKIKIVSDQEDEDKPVTRDTLDAPSEEEVEFIVKAAHTM